MPLLAARDLHVTLNTARGPAEALRGVSLTVDRGETLGLVGESGCGKSLTALALMGLLPEGATVRGSLCLDGQELVGADGGTWRTLRGRRIGMVFQEPMTALNPLHTIGHQVAEPLLQHRLAPDRRTARAEALRLLDRVRLPQAAARLDAYPHQLSGGQRQRVMIAAALACGPDLLLADEPTTALDATIQRQILALLRELVADTGMAMLLISHDLGVMAETVQRVLVMYGGTVVDEGPTERVFSRRAHPYTRGLLGARPRLGAPRLTDAQGRERKPPLATIPGRVPELADLPPGCPFSSRCERVLPACLPAPIAAFELTPGHTVRCLNLEPAPP